MSRAFLQSLLLLIGLSLAAQTLRAEPRLVTIAIDDAYPPYSYADNERAAGLYVQLVQRAAQNLPDWELRFVPRPWVRALQESEQGRVDGFLPPYRGLGRDWIGVYVGPLHHEEVVLSCSPVSRLGPSSLWPGDFGGRRVGTMRGYLLDKSLAEAFHQGLLRKREYRNARDALAALAGGEIDCYANDRLNIELAHAQGLADSVWAARMPARLEPPFVLATQQAFVAFSQQSLNRRPELAEFARLLDAQLAQLRSRGEMQRLVEKRRSITNEP